MDTNTDTLTAFAAATAYYNDRIAGRRLIAPATARRFTRLCVIAAAGTGLAWQDVACDIGGTGAVFQ